MSDWLEEPEDLHAMVNGLEWYRDCSLGARE